MNSFLRSVLVLLVLTSACGLPSLAAAEQGPTAHSLAFRPGAVLPAAPISRTPMSGTPATSQIAGSRLVVPQFAAPTVGPKTLCRLGVGQASRGISDYALYAPTELASLRTGWYESWSTWWQPPSPNGMRFVQTIGVHQWKIDPATGARVVFSWNGAYEVPYTYTVSLKPDMIRYVATSVPGSIWLVGNEIERRDWDNGNGTSAGQNEILPELYAQAYHEIYYQIKSADPTALVANGSIIVPSPLRLQYMKRMWDEYMRLYQSPMPVDVWNIHLYMTSEKRNDWGIDIPAGIDADEGLWYFGGDYNKRVLINRDFTPVPGLVNDFRKWMKDRGQQNKPLIITEYGVNMPDWVLPGEFTPEKVRDEYMVPSLNYLLSASDPALGYAPDDYRLVQSIGWYSLDGDEGWYEAGQFVQQFNGNLFCSGLADGKHSPCSTAPLPSLSTLGTYWVNYVTTVPDVINLHAVSTYGTAPAADEQHPVTGTVRLDVSNTGNVSFDQSVVVALYNNANQLIASTQVAHLPGCGETTEVSISWPNLLPGPHSFKVVIDPSGQVTETSKTDNELSGSVFVGRQTLWLPVSIR